MSSKPIFVATHPRACSTAFERVFMTRRDTIQCIHEPFGDAFYYGPERLATRFADDEAARIESGFAESTFNSVLQRIESEASEDKRIFIKDIMHYLLPPDRLPASIAPSLQRIKRGVGTNPIANGDDSAVRTANGGSCPNGTHGADGANADRRSQAPTDKYTKPLKIVTKQPYPYGTPAEPGNPTIMPKAALAQFHFAFLIRDPHFSVPSYYRCTIPPLDDVTGFYYYDPSEAGYDELRRMFDFLRAEGQIGPHVATREDSADDIVDNRRRAVVSNGLGGSGRAGDEICVIDADDLLDKPAPMIEAFCRSVGLEFDPAMLHWDSPEDHEYVGEKFEKWRGFHNDAIESGGLEARKHPRPVKTEEQYDKEWTAKYGADGAALIRRTVDANMADYLYLKQFAMRV